MQDSGKRSATDLNLAAVLINLNYNYCYIGDLFYMCALFMCCKCRFCWFRCSCIISGYSNLDCRVRNYHNSLKASANILYSLLLEFQH